MACLLPALAVMALAGCTAPAIPDLKPSVPTTWRNAPASAVPARPDLRDWWQAFDDPALNAVVGRALKGNLTLAGAAERVKAARLLDRHAHDDYLPSLRAATNDVINPDTTASYFIVGFDAMWELPLFGAWQSSARIAQGDLDANEADLQGARVTLIAEVVRRWIDLRSAQQQERILDEILAANREKLHLLEVRERLHLTSPDEVADAQADCAQAEAALADPRQAINASAQQLAALLGQPEPDPQWLQAGAQPRLGHWQLDAVPADLLRTQPQIARAEADVLSALGELGISRADIYPHIGIGTSLQWSVNIAHNHRSRTGEGIFSLGPVIDMPLFDWGQRVARAHAKDHQLKAAVYAYRQAVLQGVADTETALGDLHQSRQREMALGQAVQALDSATASARKRQQLGLASKLQVQDQRIREQQARQSLVAARAARDLAYVALYKALGGAPLPAADADHARTPDAHARSMPTKAAR
ncbi:efflux transporter outer membrane subunit [Dyella sp. A6]|uniref:efflux transporter outer membrane subunit n=1 Tax=Dyella aluminiiresistens TaxID=3069105 RepID=UPI002E795351|nr:efflux transporter outer membrane subunit [Dyella sp. A6]